MKMYTGIQTERPRQWKTDTRFGKLRVSTGQVQRIYEH